MNFASKSIDRYFLTAKIAKIAKDAKKGQVFLGVLCVLGALGGPNLRWSAP